MFFISQAQQADSSILFPSFSYSSPCRNIKLININYCGVSIFLRSIRTIDDAKFMLSYINPSITLISYFHFRCIKNNVSVAQQCSWYKMVKVPLYGFKKHIRHRPMWKPLFINWTNQLSLLSLRQQYMVLILKEKFAIKLGCFVFLTKKSYFTNSYNHFKNPNPNPVFKLSFMNLYWSNLYD